MSEETSGDGRHARPDDTPTVDEGGAGSSSAGSSYPTERPTESVADDTTERDTTESPAAPGRIRYQDPDTTTPREPTVAEARARREAGKRRRAQDEAAAAAEERKRKTRKRMLVGGGVAVGLVALVAIVYAASSSDNDEVSAQCTDQNGRVVEDRYCSGQSVGGSYGGGFVPIFLGGFGNQYHYNYGSNTPIGGTVSGGSTTPPSSGTTLRGSSGSRLGDSGTVSRGGFGVSSGSSGSGSSGSGSSGSDGGSSGS